MKNQNMGTDSPAFLDRGITVEGQIRFSHTLRVAGRIKGQIEGGEELIVEPGGQIEGKVKVKHLYVRGMVSGEEIQVERLEIFPEGRVEGNVKTTSLVVQDGGVLQASCEMQTPKAQAPAISKPQV